MQLRLPAAHPPPGRGRRPAQGRWRRGRRCAGEGPRAAPARRRRLAAGAAEEFERWEAKEQIWLRVKTGVIPKWRPGKWKRGPQPAVPLWSYCDP